MSIVLFEHRFISTLPWAFVFVLLVLSMNCHSIFPPHYCSAVNQIPKNMPCTDQPWQNIGGGLKFKWVYLQSDTSSLHDERTWLRYRLYQLALVSWSWLVMLNRAHYLERQAEKAARKGRIEEAIQLHKEAADILRDLLQSVRSGVL